MLLVQYLTVKGLAAGLFRPVAETESCSYQEHNFTRSLSGILRLRVFCCPCWHLQSRHAKDGCYPRTLIERWAIGICRGRPVQGEIPAAPQRSLERGNVSRLPSKPSQSRIGCDQFGVPWSPELERSSITLPG